MTYVAAEDRYDSMPYRRCGRSGIKLPAISLGLWNRFGDDTPIQNQRAIIRRAFDLGITHIDLANNYGPPYGSAESQLRPHLRARTSRPYRDELIISTKAGYDMWPGPYGEWGSRKYLTASLDQSLSRMGLDYVDIFYSHRFDPETPLEETIGALDTAVRQGKALYAGISSYSAERTQGGGRHRPRARHPDPDPPAVLLAAEPLDRAGGAGHLRRGGRRHHRVLPARPGHADRPLPRRHPGGLARGEGLLPQEGLHQRGQHGARAARSTRSPSGRGQKLASMALAWVLRDPRVTSALIGASSVEQLETNVAALDNLSFTDAELAEIDRHAVDAGINIWAQSSGA